MRSFVYVKKHEALPLPDEIEVLDSPSDEEVLISNDQRQKAVIFAPEIDFYIKNSKENALEKAKSVLRLYEARESVYNLGLDLEQEKSIGNKIVLVGANKTLASFLKEHGFEVLSLEEDEILALFGCAGELCAVVKNAEESFELDFDLLLFRGESRADFLRQSGCFNYENFKNEAELLEFLQSKSPQFGYKNYILYDSSLCQYHQRRTEHCGKCAELCPTTAILKDDEKKELEFSQIDCLGCGACISVCPSGSLDYAPIPRASFFELANLYQNKKILIIPQKMDLQSLVLDLPREVLPLMIEGQKWLSALHFLTLLQSSGANLVFYTDFVSEGSGEAIFLLNELFKRKFNKTAVWIAKDKIELENSLKKLEFIDGLAFSFHNRTLTTRENFAKRLEWLIAEDDLGVIPSGEWLRYGEIKINPDTCTLCLSCVGVCNVGALIADSKENALKFNASLCTTCGYCESSCAEKDTLKLLRNGMKLRSSYFKFHTLAQDKLFSCVECGKEFANFKAIERVAKLMKPLFLGDETKIKTLYCCADCKAKVMIEAMRKP